MGKARDRRRRVRGATVGWSGPSWPIHISARLGGHCKGYGPGLRFQAGPDRGPGPEDPRRPRCQERRAGAGAAWEEGQAGRPPRSARLPGPGRVLARGDNSRGPRLPSSHCPARASGPTWLSPPLSLPPARAALWSHPWLWPFDLAASVLLRSTWLRCRRPTHRASPVSSGTRNWEQGQVRPGRGRGGRRPPGRANPEQAR